MARLAMAGAQNPRVNLFFLLRGRVGAREWYAIAGLGKTSDFGNHRATLGRGSVPPVFWRKYRAIRPESEKARTTPARQPWPFRARGW